MACTLYATLYVLMEPVAGAMLAPLLLGGTAYANHLTSTYGVTANYWAIGVHVFSWIAQFVGHGVFEGRAPALLDNLVQALFLAPFFVWLEVLFFFGYRPDLKARLDSSVEKEIAKFKAEKGAKGANGSVNGKAH
jgi:2-hydroxy fatty acid dioxygenase